MRWGRVAAALIALVVLAGGAQAQISGDGAKVTGTTFARIGGMSGADSTGYMLRVDSNGYLQIADSAPDRNQFWTAVAVNNQLGRGGADSSVAIPTLGWTNMALSILPSFRADSLTAVGLAIQVRGHLTAAVDSTSTYVWLGWNGGKLAADSLGHLENRIGGTTPAQLSINGMAYSQAQCEACYLMDGERLVVASRFASTNGYLRGKLILLTGAFGEWFSSPYTSIRVRVVWVAASGGAGATVLGGDAATDMVNLNVKLVGWR